LFSSLWFGIFGVVVAVAGVTILVLRKPITQFLQIDYGRRYGDGFARLISVWSTLVFAVLVFALGAAMLIGAVLDPGVAP
jgi:hypothetical protein